MITNPTTPDSQLIGRLEQAQLVAQASLPVPRAELSDAVRIGLWGLRLFTMLLAAMVVCAFVLQLRAG